MSEKVYCQIRGEYCPRSGSDNGACHECSEADIYLHDQTVGMVTRKVISTTRSEAEAYTVPEGKLVAGIKRGVITK